MVLIAQLENFPQFLSLMCIPVKELRQVWKMLAYNLIREEPCAIYNKNASIILYLSETDSILSQHYIYDWQQFPRSRASH